MTSRDELPNINQRIAGMAAELCDADPTMNPLTAIFMAMQALDPKPGAKLVVESACHKEPKP